MPGSDVVVRALKESIALHELAASTTVEPVVAAAEAIVGALAGGGTLLVFGNGGSAADAQHVAAELVGRFQQVRRGLAAIALTADTSVLTSVANDEGYERLFARQIEALGQARDVALGISTSGTSPNVVAALEAARAGGLKTIALTGRDGGRVGQAADIHINVASASTPRVQEVHRTLLHAMCQLIEAAFVE